MKVNVQYAETHLADLISAASRGEIVEIDAPDACAQVYASPKPAVPNPPARRVLGALRGKIVVPTEEEWRAADKELERLMNEGPVFPNDPRRGYCSTPKRSYGWLPRPTGFLPV